MAKISKNDLLSPMKRAELKAAGIERLPTMVWMAQQGPQFVVSATNILDVLAKVLQPQAQAQAQAQAPAQSRASLEEMFERGLVSMEDYQLAKGQLAAASEKSESDSKSDIMRKYNEYYTRHYAEHAQPQKQWTFQPRMLMEGENDNLQALRMQQMPAAAPAPVSSILGGLAPRPFAQSSLPALPFSPVQIPDLQQQQAGPSLVDMPPTIQIPNLIPQSLQASAPSALPTLVKAATPEMAAALAHPIQNPSADVMSRMAQSVMAPNMQIGGLDLMNDMVIEDALASLHKL